MQGRVRGDYLLELDALHAGEGGKKKQVIAHFGGI